MFYLFMILFYTCIIYILVPDVKSEGDTSNFDPYPDSTEPPPKVADDQQNLFADF